MIWRSEEPTVRRGEVLEESFHSLEIKIVRSFFFLYRNVPKTVDGAYKLHFSFKKNFLIFLKAYMKLFGARAEKQKSVRDISCTPHIRLNLVTHKDFLVNYM